MSPRFDILRERLLNAGVAPRHVRRYLRELTDHLSDLVAAEEAAGATRTVAADRAYAALGDTDALTAAMTERSGFRSLSSRAPWLIFGIMPPFLLIFVMLLVVLGLLPLLGPYISVKAHISAMPQWYRPAAALVCAMINYGAGPLCALLFVGLAVRQRMTSLWPKIGFVLTAITGAYTWAWVAFPKFDGDRGGDIAVQILPSLPLVIVAGRMITTLLIAAIAYLYMKNKTARATT